MFKKTLTIFFAAILSVSACFAAFAEEAGDMAEKTQTTVARPSVTGRLKVTDGKLTDGEGNPVLLTGASTHGIGYFPQYVNEGCFSSLREMGCNVVRIAMYTDSENHAGYCNPGDCKEALKSLVEYGVKCAVDNDMYVIIDWHVLYDGDPRKYQDEAKEFFDEMSSLYADYDNVLYEICNEPNSDGGTAVTWTEIKEYAESLIPVIRGNDPDAVIIVGTPGYSSRPDDVIGDELSEWDNIMYTYHFYAASSESYGHAKAAIEAGLPIFVTECNITSTAAKAIPMDMEKAVRYLSLLDENDISYVFWSINNGNDIHAMLKGDVKDTSGFTYEDLTEPWQWLYDNVFVKNR